MIDIKFGVLFTFELLHRFFTNQVCKAFVMRASAKTSSVLAGHKMVAKQYQHQLWVGLPLDAAGNPSLVPSPDFQLTFFLQLNDPLFYNYTNLPSSLPSGKMYYFSNRNTNFVTPNKFLSQSISLYSASNTYHPGDLAAQSGGTVFQTIQTSDSAHPFPLTNTSYWKPIDTLQYVTEQDSVQWLPTVSTYAFSASQSSVTVEVRGYDIGAKDYSLLVLSKTTDFSSPVNSFTLDLSSLADGKYDLRINGASSFIYLNDELIGHPAFAILDMYNDASLPLTHALFDGSNHALSPLYTTYFLNRSTIWKFVLPNGKTGQINNPSSEYALASAVTNPILSPVPFPLKERPPLDFTLVIGGFTHKNIACPSPERLVTIQPHPPSGDIYSCSEVFLNY
jgi:hypothetical protein